MEHVIVEFDVPERRACRVLCQHRSTQRKVPRRAGDETVLREEITKFTRRYGRYGYRRIATLGLRNISTSMMSKEIDMGN